MWCHTRWLWVCFMYLWKGAVVLRTSFMPVALLAIKQMTQEITKMKILTILYARFCNRSICTLYNKLSPRKGMASKPKVKFELHLSIHLSVSPPSDQCWYPSSYSNQGQYVKEQYSWYICIKRILFRCRIWLFSFFKNGLLALIGAVQKSS